MKVTSVIKKFTQKAVLIGHITSVHEGKHLECKLCDDKFTAKSTLSKRVKVRAFKWGIISFCSKSGSEVTSCKILNFPDISLQKQTYMPIWRLVTPKLLQQEKHNIPHLKPLISAYQKKGGYGCSSSFTLVMARGDMVFCMENGVYSICFFHLCRVIYGLTLKKQ